MNSFDSGYTVVNEPWSLYVANINATPLGGFEAGTTRMYASHLYILHSLCEPLAQVQWWPNSREIHRFGGANYLRQHELQVWLKLSRNTCC